MQKTLNVLMLTLAITALAAVAFAGGGIRDEWLAQYPEACETLKADMNDCSGCHGGGFSLNGYAQAYMDNGESWTAIEGLDSDGDSQLSGQEIASCTKPWDAASLVANSSDTWSDVKNLWN